MGFRSTVENVPLVLNPSTGHISPQYHVVFDDTFSTVPSLGLDDSPPQFWNEVGLDEATYRVPLDDGQGVQLSEEWLTADEMEERTRVNVRRARIRAAMNPSLPSATSDGKPSSMPIVESPPPPSESPPEQPKESTPQHERESIPAWYCGDI